METSTKLGLGAVGLLAGGLALSQCNQGQPEILDGYTDVQPTGDVQKNLAARYYQACKIDKEETPEMKALEDARKSIAGDLDLKMKMDLDCKDGDMRGLQRPGWEDGLKLATINMGDVRGGNHIDKIEHVDAIKKDKTTMEGYCDTRNAKGSFTAAQWVTVQNVITDRDSHLSDLGVTPEEKMWTCNDGFGKTALDVRWTQ